VELFYDLGVRDWFAPLRKKAEMEHAKRYCVEKEAMTLPTFSLQVVDRRQVGQRLVYDITVSDLHAFIAGTVAVHNCIGNSGPLAPEIEREIKERDLYAVAVLSGNRNFDGRIHPLARGSFLMSPMLVVAYALVGRMDFDFSQPLGMGTDGKPVYLRDIWPSLKDVKEAIARSVNSDLYKARYANALVGDDKWLSLSSSSGDTFAWNESSTYIREPPWFEPDNMTSPGEIGGARVLALLEDKVTTDHISPAGTIQLDSPAGKYLLEHGVKMIEFSTYGSRRGNHEVMVRGGFSNIRLKNLLADGKEGGYTKYFPTGEIMAIYDAAQRYISGGIPLIILAGKQYGAGSSRDWAAKATKLLGVRAVMAESFERIHRSNLVAMGVLPLEFLKGEGGKNLGLKGDEVYSIEGLGELKPGATLNVAASSNGKEIKFKVKARIDNKAEMNYYNSGGVLPYVFRLFS
jgi:aconitate hydratase